MEEILRIQAIEEHGFDYNKPSSAFENIVNLAAEMLGFPMAVITVIETNEINIYASKGVPVKHIPREAGFCDTAIEKDSTLYIPDTLQNELASKNSLVTGPFKIRCYLGYPITISDKYRMGTLALLDQKPREVSPEQIAQFERLGAILEDYLENRRQELIQVEKTEAQLKLFRQFLDSTDDAISYVDKNWRTQYINQAGKDICRYIFGKSPDPGDYSFDYILPEDHADFKVAYKKVFEGERIIMEKTVKEKTWTLTLDPVYSGPNEIVGLVYTVSEITDRVTRLNQLNEHNKILKQIAWEQTHLVRKPVANILGLCQLLFGKLDGGKEKNIARNLKIASEELDSIIRNSIDNLESTLDVQSKMKK
ncbi:GAF domain-containing protein [Luteibaculum oceani]|uniref:PAS domain S-box protein n=1 Tax=Luteibaculum oceani TaxID=1294296 RepID=A0A5C6UVH7_9FLAO|nr:GAF domain-containing protein [Luteibaculum oceani]TXC76221.1 PAS domain S-box protein [Luteibaculum oceani]